MGKDAAKPTPTAVEVVGAIDVAEANLPSDMPADARQAARRRKINDIVIVLENQEKQLSDVLSARISDHLPDAAAPEVVLSFDAREPSFVVRLPLPGTRDRTRRRAIGEVLAQTVKTTLAEHISNAASRTGTWEPIITAEAVGERRASLVAGARMPKAVWWRIAAIVGAAVILALYIRAGG